MLLRSSLRARTVMFGSFTKSHLVGVSTCVSDRHSLPYGHTLVPRRSRTVECFVAAPLSPHASANRLSDVSFSPRRDPASKEAHHSPVLTTSPNLPQSRSPEPLYERLRKECRSGRSTDAVVFTVMAVCAQAGALPLYQQMYMHTCELSLCCDCRQLLSLR